MEIIRALIAGVDDLHDDISAWEETGVHLQGRRDRLVEALVDAGLKPKRVRNEVARIEFNVTWPKSSESVVTDMSSDKYIEYPVGDPVEAALDVNLAARKKLAEFLEMPVEPFLENRTEWSTGGENADER